MNDDEIDPTFMEDVEKAIPELTQNIMGSKIKEQELLNQSMRDGGPSTPLEAIHNLMSYCNIGVRDMSRRISISRTKLRDMLDGKMNIPPDVLNAMYGVFEKLKPHLFV